MHQLNTPIKRSRIAILAALAAMAFGAASAQAAVYTDGSVGGGGIAIKIKNGKAKSLRAAIPADCDRPNGDFTTTLRTHLTGSLKLNNGRFNVHVDDPNTGVEVIVAGKRKNGTVKGTIRLTYLELHPGSPSNDTLCDSGVHRYEAS
jgi:hypothetical protein